MARSAVAIKAKASKPMAKGTKRKPRSILYTTLSRAAAVFLNNMAEHPDYYNTCEVVRVELMQLMSPTFLTSVPELVTGVQLGRFIIKYDRDSGILYNNNKYYYIDSDTLDKLLADKPVLNSMIYSVTKSISEARQRAVVISPGLYSKLRAHGLLAADSKPYSTAKVSLLTTAYSNKEMPGREDIRLALDNYLASATNIKFKDNRLYKFKKPLSVSNTKDPILEEARELNAKEFCLRGHAHLFIGVNLGDIV